MKLKLMLHSVPGPSERMPSQSGTVPGPATTVKSRESLRAPEPVKGWFPIFSNCTDLGLSLLVSPTFVAAKVRAGGCERSITWIDAGTVFATPVSGT